MSDTRFNIPADVWERAVGEISDLLAGIARSQETVTYSDLAARVTTLTLQPHSRAFHHMLGDVAERAYAGAGPLLSALVVSKDWRRPGPGFFDLARRLGFTVERDRVSEDVFWAEQVDALHQYWRTR